MSSDLDRVAAISLRVLRARRAARLLALAHYDEIRRRAFAADNPFPLLRRLHAAEVSAEALVPILSAVPVHLRGWWVSEHYHAAVADPVGAAVTSLLAEGDA